MAGIEAVNIRRTGTAQLAQGSGFSIEENKFAFMTANPTTWQAQFDQKTVKDKILLGFDKYSDRLIPDHYAIRIELAVTYSEWNNSISAFQTKTLSQNPVIEIEYNKLSSYTDRSLFQFTGGHAMQISIVNIWEKNSVNGTYQSVSAITTGRPVYLETEISVERYYTLSAGVPTGLKYKTLTGNNLPVYWNVIPGAEEYELEWTHVDDFTNGSSPNAALNPATIVFTNTEGFRFNSSRIITSSTYYEIPALYERGYILFRVRGVGRSASDSYLKNKYSLWSDQGTTYSTVAGFPQDHRYQISGHENKLNWQNSTSFAEEGKNKASVSYYDGTLRNRQVSTRMNSQQETIIGETIYDQQGRPAIQVLPVPSGQNTLNYRPGLNKDVNGGEYNKDDFDNANSCVEPAPPMSGTNPTDGAARYYSPNNSNQSDENRLIPDAEGRPFTQTVYSPDNTGRIKAQSGVGSTHTINSEHETRYFYSKPSDQKELDRLFGAEVGEFERYKKNMVIDANGQISVSYLDPQGRVVATALAGDAPLMLDALPSTKQTRTSSMMSYDESNNRYRGESVNSNTGEKELNKSFLVSDKGVRTFDYTYSNTPFIAVCSSTGVLTNPEQANRCYECIMQLRIELKDDCGNSYLVGLDPAIAGSNSVVIGNSILESLRNGSYVACQSSTQANTFMKSGWQTSDFANNQTSKELPPGSYIISRVLAVNNEALDLYVADYLTNNSCLLKVDDFLEKESLINIGGGCGETCTECIENLGEYAQYNENLNPDCDPCLSYDEYLNEAEECKDLCEDKSNECDALYEGMLNDITPNGQYAGVLLTESGVEYNVFSNPEKFPLSVLSFHNSIPRKKWHKTAGAGNTEILPNWRFPYFVNAQNEIQYYYPDEDGNPDLVELLLTDDGVYAPEVDPVEQPYIVHTNEGRHFIRPQYLKYVQDFVARFKEQWATALVVYHPEYPYYQYCTRISNSHDFDYKYSSIEDYITYFQLHPDEAIALLSPLGTSTSNAYDPFFKFSTNPELKQADYTFMREQLQHYTRRNDGVTSNGGYFSLKQVALLTSVCANKTVSGNAQVTCESLACTEVNFPDELTYWTNDTWRSYISLYVALKKSIIEKKMTVHAIKNGYYNGCIGVPSFNSTKDGFLYAPYHDISYNDLIFQQQWDRYNRRYFGVRPNYFAFRRFYQSQYYNYSQPCNCLNYELYKGKTKNFVRTRDAIDGNDTDMSTEFCEYYLPQDPDYGSDFQFEQPNCEEEGEWTSPIVKNRSDFKYYEDCGLCPVVREVESLISSIAESETYNLSTPYITLNCPMSTTTDPNVIASLSDEMQALLFGPNTGATDPVIWQKISSTANELTCRISKAGNNATVFLKINSIQSFTMSDGTVVPKTVQWSDVVSLCCIEPVNIPGYPTGKTFSGRAGIKVVHPTSGKTEVIKISIEGYTDKVDLNTCSPPVKCTSVDLARDFTALWNGLLYTADAVVTTDGSTAPAITSVFISNGTITLDNNVDDYNPTGTGMSYENFISANMIASLSTAAPAPIWTWNGSVDINNTFTGLLSRINTSGQSQGAAFVEMKFQESGLSWNNVVRFKTIRPDMSIRPGQTVADPEHNFEAVVVVTVNGARVNKIVKGYSGIVLAECVVAVFKTRN